MYLDVLKLLMPNLRQGAGVLADDVTLFPDDVACYLDYVRNPANGFVTVTLPLDDGIEYLGDDMLRQFHRLLQQVL